MPYLFRTYDKNGKPHPRWRFEYRDWQGKKRKLTGSTSEEATREKAEEIEEHHRLIRAGKIPQPRSHALPRDFWETAEEYLAWGAATGGKDGRPWAAGVEPRRRMHLAWWRDRLKLDRVADLDGVLPRVEAAARDLAWREVKDRETGKMKRVPRTPLTVGHYRGALEAFASWAYHRGYLTEDPLARGKAPRVREAKAKRRALEPHEIRALLDACEPRRRLAYELALASGLRANELRSLTRRHLNTHAGGLKLDAAWTKNRKPGFQILHPILVAKLAAAVERGDAAKAYARAHEKARRAGRKVKWTPPAEPLVYLGHHSARDLDYDLKRAGIPKWLPGGKIDFHALRVTFASLVDESQASAGVARDLMRHASLQETSGYTRTRTPRLAQAADAVGGVVLGPEAAPMVPQRQAVGAEQSAQDLELVEVVSEENDVGRNPMHSRQMDCVVTKSRTHASMRG